LITTTPTKYYDLLQKRFGINLNWQQSKLREDKEKKKLEKVTLNEKVLSFAFMACPLDNKKKEYILLKKFQISVTPHILKADHIWKYTHQAHSNQTNKRKTEN
jgi:hypothetical protein